MIDSREGSFNPLHRHISNIYSVQKKNAKEPCLHRLALIWSSIMILIASLDRALVQSICYCNGGSIHSEMPVDPNRVVHSSSDKCLPSKQAGVVALPFHHQLLS